MKAIILAAGKGTRMGELTNKVPKPMLRVKDKPILEHIMTSLVSHGIKEIFIVTGHNAEIIKDYFGDGSKIGAKIVYGFQEVQDGTGKAPEIARSFIGDDTFLLTYGDILVESKTYGDMLERFKENTCAGLITCIQNEDVGKGALVICDESFFIKKIVEKPSSADLELLRREGIFTSQMVSWNNAGIYIFTPILFEFTKDLKKSPRGEYELPDAVNAMISKGEKVTGLAIKGRWVDVRDPKVLAELQ